MANNWILAAKIDRSGLPAVTMEIATG